MSQSNLVNPSFFSTAKGVSFDQDVPRSRRVNLQWFLPLLPVEDRLNAELFLNEWLIFGTYQNDFGYGWQSRIENLLGAEDEQNEASARVVASMFSWFGMNNGFSFLQELLKKLDPKEKPFGTFSDDNTKKALAEWAQYSSRTSIGGYYHLEYQLYNILGISDRRLTFYEMSAAHRVIVFISHGEGLEFLLKVLDKIAAREKAKSDKMRDDMGIKVQN